MSHSKKATKTIDEKLDFIIEHGATQEQLKDLATKEQVKKFEEDMKVGFQNVNRRLDKLAGLDYEVEVLKQDMREVREHLGLPQSKA